MGFKEVFSGSKTKKTVLLLLSVCTLFSVYIMLTRYVFMYANENMRADVAGQIVQMWEMRRTGTMFPKGWVDSSEIHLLAYPMYFISFIVNDGILVRNIAMFMFDCILLALVIGLYKTMFHSRGYLIAIPVIFSNMFPGFFARLFFKYGDYLQSVFYICLIIILLFTAFDDDLNVRSGWQRILFLLTAVISTFLGFQGWAQVIVPLCAALCICLYDRIREERTFSSGTFKKILTSPFSLMIYQLVIAGVIGTVLHEVILAKLINVPGLGGATRFADTEALADVPRLLYLGILEELFNVQPGTSFFSGSGIQVFARIFAFYMLFVHAPRKALDWRQDSTRMKISKLYTVIAVAEMTLILFLGQSYSYASCIRYYAIPLFMVLIFDGEYLYRHFFAEAEESTSLIHAVLVCGLTLVFAADLLLPLNFRQNYRETMASSRGITDCLREKGLTYGYSLYGNSNNNTAYANNTVKVVPVAFGGEHEFLQSRLALSSWDWYDPDYYHGKSFLLIYKNDLELYDTCASYADGTLLKDMTVDQFEYEEYVVWVFDHNLLNDMRYQ